MIQWGTARSEHPSDHLQKQLKVIIFRQLAERLIEHLFPYVELTLYYLCHDLRTNVCSPGSNHSRELLVLLAARKYGKEADRLIALYSTVTAVPLTLTIGMPPSVFWHSNVALMFDAAGYNVSNRPSETIRVNLRQKGGERIT